MSESTATLERTDTPETKGADNVADTKAREGTDGGEQATAALQTGETTGEKETAATGLKEGDGAPPPPSTPAEDPVAKAKQQILDDQKAAERAAEVKKAQDDLRDFRRHSPDRARGVLDEIEDELGVRISLDLRKKYINLIEEANLKAEPAARMALNDEGQEGAHTLMGSISNALDSAVPRDKLSQFQKDTESKPWPQVFEELRNYPSDKARGAIAADTRAQDAEDFAAALPEGEWRDALKEAAGEKDRAKRAKAIILAARNQGRHDPAGSYTGTERASGSGDVTYADLLRWPEPQKAKFIAEHPDEYQKLLGIRK